ncbi:antigen identified by monoclonal antibody Ki-67 [Coemansia sp. RSA 637]|nr:antigen identified by monoclonal antibody Ki-67 [Coemansia sp. RSA 637]
MAGHTLAMAEPTHGKLVIISRTGADGKAFPMHSSRVVIGRKETCDIRMQRAEVSKEHCVIRVNDGRVVLTNLSDNGTAINEAGLTAGQQHTLQSGDVITIVGRSLRYERAQVHTPLSPHRRLASLHRPQSEIISRPQIRRDPIGSALFTARRAPRDAETARKFRLWNEHYDDDPFSTAGESEASTSAFQRMAASVQRFNAGRTTCSPLRRTVSNGGPMLLQTPEGDGSSDEVPTEPESEPEPEAPPSLMQQPRTPIARRVIMSDILSAARKSVRFGPPLRPELFDALAPPASPLRRGTPLQMARASSILRQSAEQMDLESALPLSAESEEDAEAREPIREIESPVALGSPEDRRSRRRRSLRAVRRATLQPRAADTSPMIKARTRDTHDLTPSRLFKSDAATRKERRRTAPESLSTTMAEMAEMAAALGEDVPAAFKKPEKPAPLATPEQAAKKDEKEEEPVPKPVIVEQPDTEKQLITTEQPLGLADAMHMLENMPPTNSSEISPPIISQFTDQLLREQAELQARFGLVSVVEPLRQRRRQTTNFEHLREPSGIITESSELKTETSGINIEPSEIETEAGSGPGAHHERLRRQQERRRRRQTIAALKQRRSSWRGWTHGANELLSSPPQSPPSHMPASPASPLSAPTTAETAVGTPSSLLSASLTEMYPPPAWNRAAESRSFERSQPTTSSEPDRMLPTRRRLSVHAYPPRPTPIDADWELVNAEPSVVSAREPSEPPAEELHSQNIDLHATPAIACENRDTLSDSGDRTLGPIIVQQESPVFSPPRTRSGASISRKRAASVDDSIDAKSTKVVKEANADRPALRSSGRKRKPVAPKPSRSSPPRTRSSKRTKRS